MPSFAYQAKDATGKSVNGVIEAENERVLRAKLREMNYYVTGITQKQTAGLNADVQTLFGGVIGKLEGVSRTSACRLRAAVCHDDQRRIGDGAVPRRARHSN